jgi:hypothetical protein
MPLSPKQLNNVCLINDEGSKKCRYLAQDEQEYDHFYCLKKSAKKQECDEAVEEYVNDSIKKGQNPGRGNSALGDNCQGFPILRHKLQGYDQ